MLSFYNIQIKMYQFFVWLENKIQCFLCEQSRIRTIIFSFDAQSIRGMKRIDKILATLFSSMRISLFFLFLEWNLTAFVDRPNPCTQCRWCLIWVMCGWMDFVLLNGLFCVDDFVVVACCCGISNHSLRLL